MATFDEFYKSLDPDSGIRGKQFEKFVKWFLKTDPEWQSQVEEVWLWDEYPERWGRDSLNASFSIIMASYGPIDKNSI